jgi:serine/threonine protein kinase
LLAALSLAALSPTTVALPFSRSLITSLTTAILSRQQVNHYNILSSLGSGSYGMVKLCQNQLDMQFYAMKMVPVNRESDLQRQSHEAIGAAKKQAQYQVSCLDA